MKPFMELSDREAACLRVTADNRAMFERVIPASPGTGADVGMQTGEYASPRERPRRLPLVSGPGREDAESLLGGRVRRP